MFWSESESLSLPFAGETGSISLVVDFNDFLGVVLGAYYPLYPKEDSPDPAWNEAARRANQIEKARWEAIKAKLEAEREAEWQAGLAACREEGVEILSADRKTGEIRFRLEGKERVSRPGWGEMPWEHPAGLAQAVRKWKFEAQYAARYYEEVIEPVRRGEEPFFTAGNFALYYTGRNRVECPENLIPHLIGRGGQGIKGIEKALGVRLHIVKVAPVSLGRKDKIWRLSPPKVEIPGEEVKK